MIPGEHNYVWLHRIQWWLLYTIASKHVIHVIICALVFCAFAHKAHHFRSEGEKMTLSIQHSHVFEATKEGYVKGNRLGKVGAKRCDNNTFIKEVVLSDIQRKFFSIFLMFCRNAFLHMSITGKNDSQAIKKRRQREKTEKLREE